MGGRVGQSPHSSAFNGTTKDCPVWAAVSLSSKAGLMPRTTDLLMEVERVMKQIRGLWSDDGQDIAEYAVMLAVLLVIVVGTIRLIGSNANNVFSSVASSIQ